MALSKAYKPGKLFVLKASGTDDAAGTIFTSAVNTGNIVGGSPQIQWKMKELLFSRSAAGATTLTMQLVDLDANVFDQALVSGFTTSSARIAATLSSGEYLFDADSEIRVTSTGLGVGETWDLRITGQVVG